MSFHYPLRFRDTWKCKSRFQVTFQLLLSSQGWLSSHDSFALILVGKVNFLLFRVECHHWRITSFSFVFATNSRKSHRKLFSGESAFPIRPFLCSKKDLGERIRKKCGAEAIKLLKANPAGLSILLTNGLFRLGPKLCCIPKQRIGSYFERFFRPKGSHKHGFGGYFSSEFSSKSLLELFKLTLAIWKWNSFPIACFIWHSLELFSIAFDLANQILRRPHPFEDKMELDLSGNPYWPSIVALDTSSCACKRSLHLLRNSDNNYSHQSFSNSNSIPSPRTKHVWNPKPKSTHSSAWNEKNGSISDLAYSQARWNHPSLKPKRYLACRPSSLGSTNSQGGETETTY